MRRIVPVEGNRQRLDGGAMFGNVPRVLWEQWHPPDELGRIELACRAMLVEDGDRRILFETGIGAFFEPKLKDRYGVVESEHVLLSNLARLGYADADIDAVVLSHLHFDHAGGLLAPWEKGQPARLLFENATILVSQRGFNRAMRPHRRDRASFIPELPELLQKSGRLEIVDGEGSPTLGEGYRFYSSNGHTPGLMLTEVQTDEGPVLFMGDLVPGAAWMHLSISMGYDRFPELIIDEKQLLLAHLLARQGRVFFTHDPNLALARVAKDDRGRYVAEPL